MAEHMIILNMYICMYRVQNECEHELQEELGIEEGGMQQIEVDNLCHDQVAKVR